MTMWLPNLESRKGPVYRAIADAIDEDVDVLTKLRPGLEQSIGHARTLFVELLDQLHQGR